MGVKMVPSQPNTLSPCSANFFSRMQEKIGLQAFFYLFSNLRHILNWQMTRKEIKKSLIFYIIDPHQGLKNVLSRIERKDLLNVAA